MISWSVAFSGRYDSPWCITQKLAWLNATSPRAILNDIAKRPIQGNSFRSVRSFTDLRWWGDVQAEIARDPPGHTASDRLKAANALIVTEELAAFLTLGSPLMSDSLRICPTCVSEGYHSVVHQLAGLERCPIHRRKIVEHCPACRRSLGVYAVGGTCGFGCSSCGKSLLKENDLPPCSQKLLAHELRYIAPLVKWISRTLPCVSVPWNRKFRNIAFAHPIARKVQPISLQAALFHTLTEIEACPLDKTFLGPAVPQLRVILEPKKSRSRSATESCESSWNTAKRVISETEAWLENNMLGEHQKCYEKGGSLMSWGRLDHWHLGFHPNFCVTAYAFVLWSARAHQLLETFGLSSFVRGPIDLDDGSDLRRRLISSYHYCLHSLDLLRSLYWEGDNAAFRKILDCDLLDLAHDPWIQFDDRALGDKTLRKLSRNDVYFAARDADQEVFCDHFECFEASMDLARKRFRQIDAHREVSCDHFDCFENPIDLGRKRFRQIYAYYAAIDASSEDSNVVP